MYDALSYCWGTSDAIEEIKILQFHQTPGRAHSFKDIQPGTFYVRPTLYAALHKLRDPKQSKVLWVDAICINQDDVIERNQQVSKMAEIYSLAAHISVWLGDGTTESDMAMEFIDKISDPHRFDLLLEDASTVPQWHALLLLMQRPWFSRRWIIQEIMIARKATLYCGKFTQNWSNFAGIIQLIGERLEVLKRIFARSSVYGGDAELLSDLQTSGAYSLAQATSALLRKSNDGGILERLCTLEELLLALPTFECGNLRDTVYAVLSLAKDAPSSLAGSVTTPDLPLTSQPNIPMSTGSFEFQGVLEVNYNKSIPEVLADVIKFYIDSRGQLDIICRHWAPPKGIPDLPSWILPLSTTPKFSGRGYRNWGIKIPESLVGRPNHRNYNASGRVPYSVTFGSSEVQWSRWKLPIAGKVFVGQRVETAEKRFNGVMFVKGLRLNSIGKLGPRAAEGVIPYEWLDMIDIDREDMKEAFWRILVANRSSDQTAPPDYYRRSWQSCMNTSHYGDINITELTKDANSMVSRFLKRVQSVIWNRKFFVTKSKEGKLLLGLAPLEAKEDDVICILFGCSVPVIIREHIDRGCAGPEGRYFEFIGESYVHGMMDGEAVNQLTQEELHQKGEVFKIK
jgi:hypothetical protein